MVQKSLHEILYVMRNFLSMHSIFLDTNFFLDIFDVKRERHIKAKIVLEKLLKNDVELYTSSDIISTVSYFLQKKLDLKSAVINIDFIVQKIIVLVADNIDFITLNKIIFEKLEQENTLKIDYEDCMQLFLTHKYGVESIITSDGDFCKGIKEDYPIRIVGLDDMVMILE